MNYIVAYQINTVGNCQGLPIASGFGIAVLITVQKSSQEDNDNFDWYLEVQAVTSIDSSFTQPIAGNSDLIGEGWVSGGNTKTYGLVSADLDKAVRTLTKNKVRPDLDNAYGASNVVEL
jgi:hypothetical protein